MSFVDRQPRIATAEDLAARWDGLPPGEGLRCYLCSAKILLGQVWRFVYANHRKGSLGNFLVCAACDGPDIVDRYVAACEELLRRFWWCDPLHRRCSRP